jgi:hypothetical protein
VLTSPRVWRAAAWIAAALTLGGAAIAVLLGSIHAAGTIAIVGIMIVVACVRAGIVSGSEEDATEVKRNLGHAADKGRLRSPGVSRHSSSASTCMGDLLGPEE